jgi:hypothetical protein
MRNRTLEKDKITYDDLSMMLEDCLKRKKKLSEWEYGFAEALHKYFKKNYLLTERQTQILCDIWEKATGHF